MLCYGLRFPESSRRQPFDNWNDELDLDLLQMMVDAGPRRRYDPNDSARFFAELGLKSEAERNLCDFVERVFAASTPEELRLQLEVIPDGLRSSDSVAIFQGLGAPVTLQHLYGRLQKFTPEQFIVAGRIRDFIYDPRSEHGHLSVDVETTFLTTPLRREFLHWDVEARLRAHKRESSEANPFPDVDLVLPENLRNNFNPDGSVNADSIWSRGLDVKLHARGCEVKVEKVYQRINDGPLELLPFWHPYYSSTDTSCVDLLVASLDGQGERLPTTYQELRRFLPGEQRPLYCLGRCGHPTIVNSGT